MSLNAKNVEEIAKAIYTINRHVKTASDKKPLYELKRQALHKLIDQQHAKKLGLHFSDHPTKSKQQSSTLIQVQDYFFHLPIEASDKGLPHLGELDVDYANPHVSMSLHQAKKLIQLHLNLGESVQTKITQPKKRTYSGLTSTPSPSEYRRLQKNPFKK